MLPPGAVNVLMRGAYVMLPGDNQRIRPGSDGSQDNGSKPGNQDCPDTLSDLQLPAPVFQPGSGQQHAQRWNKHHCRNYQLPG